MLPRGLIFDCDGVLVDSEPLAVEELVIMLRGLDVPIDAARIYDEFLGRAITALITAVADEFDTDLRPALPEYAARLQASFRQRLQPVSGMAEVLSMLQGPRAVASSSDMKRLSMSLQITGIAPFFMGNVYSAAMVGRGKPAPDLFLHAAKAIGMDPGDCIVIEDSPAGIQAARAAGMRVVGFLGGSHAAQARLSARLSALHPDAMIESAADLPDTLSRLN